MSTAYDLRLAANELTHDKRFVGLARDIKRFLDGYSVRTDLEEAASLLTTLQDLQNTHFAKYGDMHYNVKGQSEYDKSTHSNALIGQIIVLYARATNTKSDDRGKIDISSQLSTQELELHRQVCGLRNKAIAHFGAGEVEIGVDRVREVPYLICTPDNRFDTRVMTCRTALDPKLSKNLQVAVSRAR